MELSSKEKKDKGIFDWEINCTTPTEMLIYMTLYADSWILKKVFMASVAELKKKKIEVEGNPDLIQSFEIYPKYYKLLLLNIRRLVRIVIRNVAEDNIKIQDYGIKRAYFVRDSDDSDIWNIKLTLTGNYIDLR